MRSPDPEAHRPQGATLDPSAANMLNAGLDISRYGAGTGTPTSWVICQASRQAALNGLPYWDS